MKNKKKEIVYFSCVPWNFLFQRPHHILSILAKRDFKIIYVEPFLSNLRLYTKMYIDNQIFEIIPGLDLPFVKNVYKNRIKIDNLIIKTRAVTTDKCYVHNATYINNAKKNHYHSICISIKAIMQYLDFTNPMIWTSQPYWMPIISMIRPSSVIYDCLDEISAFTGHSSVVEFEKELIRKSNLIFCTAERLVEKCRVLNNNSHLLPNAVDYNHFKKALDKNTRIPDDVKHLPSPVIGYVGCVGDWFDLDLVIDIAKNNKNWSFLIIGPVPCKILEENKIPPNLYFVGKRNYNDLPNYLKKIDVSIIPFKITPLTLSTDPVKFYEYIAAGKPVVSTDLPEIRKYKDIVNIASNSKEFSEGIKKALKTPINLRYSDIAKQNTWDIRCDKIMNLLTNF
jgi:glycosyltransferase involved in cell wall biosynthesis